VAVRLVVLEAAGPPAMRTNVSVVWIVILVIGVELRFGGGWRRSVSERRRA